MERVQFVLDRLSSRTFVSLSVLYALQHSALRRVFVRCVCAGAAATVFVLNFGLDLESARARRRALAAGVSRALCAAAAVHTVRSSHIKAKLFWTGVLLRCWPALSWRVVSALHSALHRLRGQHSTLPDDNNTEKKRFVDDTCAICLEEQKEEEQWSNLCGHAFHRPCIERWASKEPICPVCKEPIPVQDDLLADYLLFSESKWIRQHAVLGSLFWER